MSNTPFVTDPGISGFTYQTDKLSAGHTLSRLLMERVDLSQGNFHALMPEEIAINSTVSLEQSIYWQLHSNPQKESLDSVETAFERIIHDHLLTSHNAVCLYEDLVAGPGDPCITSDPGPWMAYGSELYWMNAGKQISPSAIDLVVRSISLDWFFRGVLSYHQDPQKLMDTRTIEKHDLLEITENMMTIFHVAFDGEGFILWSQS